VAILIVWTSIQKMERSSCHGKCAAFEVRKKSSSYDNTIKIWDLDQKKPIKVIQEHSDNIWSAKFSPNGKLIVSGQQIAK